MQGIDPTWTSKVGGILGQNHPKQSRGHYSTYFAGPGSTTAGFSLSYQEREVSVLGMRSGLGV